MVLISPARRSLKSERESESTEDVTPEGVIPLRVSVAVAAQTTTAGAARNERWLAVEDIVDSNSEGEVLFHPEQGGQVEIALRVDFLGELPRLYIEKRRETHRS